MPKRTRRQPIRNVVPDRLDLRDRVYQPSVRCCPDGLMLPQLDLPVLDQGQTNACTGFALATLVNFLLRRKATASRRPPEVEVSPQMLYSMARRYDEIPGVTADTGSSLRAAMKGWYKHGACRKDLWDGPLMPKAAKRPEDDWWLDAAQRPLGAYYRVEVRSVTDMHVALQEVGVLLASAVCHAGWARGFDADAGAGDGRFWRIPHEASGPGDGGHAFVIVGYDQHGFLIQNSWGRAWGTRGLAVLSYEDWLENAMDAWVAQPGVVTEQHLEIANSLSLRTRAGVVQLAPDEVLRNREISPFVIDVENDGALSTTGEFRTQPGDVDALTTTHVEQARATWGLKATDPMDVAIYAHGGLVGEKEAASTAAKWIPALYDRQIFPIFLMWESDLLTTLGNMVEDTMAGQPRPAGGLGSMIANWWNERLEGLLKGPGSAVWGEMKENAELISTGKDSGGRVLYTSAEKSPWFGKGRVRLHLIGHSAGAIVMSHIVDALCKRGWGFETVNFMAPAVRVDTFEATVLPRIRSGQVKRLNQFHLSDVAEQTDPTCKRLLGYSRSLLYLVSRSFEGGVETPILGMQRHFDAAVARWKADGIHSFTAPSAASQSTTHGGFDDDDTTREKVIALIRGSTQDSAVGAGRGPAPRKRRRRPSRT